jgi:TniQ
MPEAPLQADGLVRHPRPYPTESLFGYILRLAEENGYPTPSSIFALIGIRNNQFMSRRLPLQELARVAHRELGELERIAYYCGDPRQYRLLGRPVASHELKRISHVSLCPECVRSSGFIEAHWDLELMTGCPVHRTRLLSFCPKCHLSLRWLRPGQLECNCGAMLGRVDGPILPEDEAELLDIIRRKVLGLPISQESSTGIPTSQLSTLGLRGLLFLIGTLAKFHLQLESVKQLDDSQSVVTAAAYVLRSFPDNFHRLLWTIGEQHVPKQCGGYVRSQFSHIYDSIFKFRTGDPPQTRDFLGRAFLDFATKQWGRGVVNANLLSRLQNGIPKRFVTRAEFGERHGLGKRVVARVFGMKNISTITIPAGKTNRTFIDLQQLHEPLMIPRRIFTLRTAAAAIGVTASVFRKLRASGHFEVKYLIRRKGYHERDIKQFIERLLALNPSATNMNLPPDCITLYQAMYGYHGTGEGGASIIRALLSGELQVLGNVDGTVRGLFVSRAEFQQFGKNDRARQNGNARTPSEVAKELRCHMASVPGLVAAKLLDGWNTPTGLRISEASIAKFKKKYVSLASIAREIGSRAPSLMGHCVAKQIPMVFVKYAYNKSKQAFVRLKDRNAALSFRPVRVLNKPKAANQERPNRAVSSPINRTAMEFTERAS